MGLKKKELRKRVNRVVDVGYTPEQLCTCIILRKQFKGGGVPFYVILFIHNMTVWNLETRPTTSHHCHYRDRGMQDVLYLRHMNNMTKRSWTEFDRWFFPKDYPCNIAIAVYKTGHGKFWKFFYGNLRNSADGGWNRMGQGRKMD